MLPQFVGADSQNDPNAPPLHLKGGEIRFENVTFGYHPDRQILRNCSFTIPAGSKTALVGPSGSGKSTVFRLLFRFYEPQSGRILVDGQDISKVSLESLRKNIGVVPQETPLFNDNILNNLRYGRIDASDAQVRHAAKLARVDEVVERLPHGYDTRVGERGLMISGGEKQRLAIARLLLKDPGILFFDEATSALDSETETALMRNINAMVSDMHCTAIFSTSHRAALHSQPVAHRLRTINDADLIIVLDGGTVREEGTHAQLLEERGTYSHLWDAQVTSVVSDQPQHDSTPTAQLDQSNDAKSSVA